METMAQVFNNPNLNPSWLKQKYASQSEKIGNHPKGNNFVEYLQLTMPGKERMEIKTAIIVTTIWKLNCIQLALNIISIFVMRDGKKKSNSFTKYKICELILDD